MLTIKVSLLLLFLISTECAKSRSRQYANSKKESNRVVLGKSPARNEVFDNLFNVYDPSFLAVVWPKVTNGMHILVDHTCWEDLGFFFKELTEGRSWAYNVLDATGRYGSALFSGDRFWLGSKELCLRVDKDVNVGNRTIADINNDIISSNKYFDHVAHEWKWVEDELSQRVSDNRPPYRLAYTVLEMTLNITKFNLMKSHYVTLGVCMPRTCSPRDITSIINFSIMVNDNLKSNKTTSRLAKITSVRRVLENYSLVNDNGGVILICITATIVTLAIVATAVDLDWFKCLPYGKKTMTFDLEKYNTESDRTADKLNIKLTNDLKTEIDRLGVEKANINYKAVENIIRGAPMITLDVNCEERTPGSCTRCGKYRKQCNNTRVVENLPPCPRHKSTSFSSLSTERKQNLFCRLLLCFSLAYCWKRIFNTKIANNDLSLIHAMRILATFWVIFVHVAVMVDYISDDASDINKQNNIYHIIATGTIAFDTLFFVSGLFSSHHFFFLKSQYSVKDLVGFRGACGQVLQFGCFVTNRVIRLLPSYGFVVLLTAVLTRSSRLTATLALPDGDDHNCHKYGWRNLLYITNIYPAEQQCMQISWYLSTETQLHMVGALLCAVSASSNMRARLSVSLALIAVLASTIADASAAYFDFGQFFSNAFSVYATIIERPWARIAPYFIGVFTGWLIHFIKGKLKVSKVTSVLLWMTSFSFIFTSCVMPMVGLPWLAAWLHLCWPIALLWPVLIGTTNLAGVFRQLLSSSSMVALSRLCYGMLLLHAVVARSVLLSTDSALCSYTTCIWLYFAGTTILTILVSFLLSMLVEMPCCSLLRRISDCAS